MAKITIDINSLRANSNALNDRISELQNLNGRLEALITKMQNSWEGQSSERYISGMRERMAKAKQMVEVLSEYKKYVDEAVQRFSDIDKNSASRIRNSF